VDNKIQNLLIASLLLNAVTLVAVLSVGASGDSTQADTLSIDIADIDSDITAIQADLQSLKQGVTIRETPGPLFGGIAVDPVQSKLSAIEAQLSDLSGQIDGVCSAVRSLNSAGGFSPYYGC
jgi:hypothetical protein